MPKWDSINYQGSLNILSEGISGRFSKETGDITLQGVNVLIVHKNRSTGVERSIVAEEASVWEDSRYVYFRTNGRTVESIQQIPQRRNDQQRQKKVNVG